MELVECVEEVYYYEYYESEQPTIDDAGVSAVLAAGSCAVNFAFIHNGQSNNFAAGVGILFGAASLAVAATPQAKYPLLSAALGTAAIAFSVWNLMGGMDNAPPRERVPTYDGYDSYYSTRTAGQTASFTFSF